MGVRNCSNPKSLNSNIYMLTSYEDLEENSLGEMSWPGYFWGWCFVHKKTGSTDTDVMW